jgi:DNA-binding transcriptional LysR family regulator
MPMLEALDVFATVVELNSLNQAAKKLNISQPALSRKISSLEQKLGVQLFERQGKRLKLTKIGQVSYEYALEFRQLLHRFEKEVARYATSESANITIGASLTTLQSTLPDLIMLLIEIEPDTDIQTITGKTHEIVTLVKEQKVDLGLVASKIDHPDLKCVPLFDDHLCLVLPKQHIILNQPKFGVEDLNGLPMILFSKGTWYRILMDEWFHKYHIYPEIKMEIDSFEAIIRLVSTCKIATLLPESYLRPSILADNDLIKLDIQELKQTTRTTALLYNTKTTLHPTIQQLIKKAVTFF